VRDDGEPEAMTDALMSSHIRYRGFQGELRQFTAPISFDLAGMEAILALDEFAEWRLNGLMVSDSLGVPAVRKYFDPTLDTFPHRRIAKEAFLAGNDLLLLSQFDLNNVWADQRANIRDTVAFFQQEYRDNPDFAARVDRSVVRILRLKLKLYPEFTLEAVQVHADAALQVCGLGTQVTQRIANQAITLLYPDANALPPAPRPGEKVVIFTDARPVRECFSDQCPTFSPLSQTAVEEAILSEYGPEGTEQIQPEDITSLPFGQLKKLLQGEQTESDVQALLEEADWIVFAQQDLNPVKGPNSDTVKLYLNHSLSASHTARLVVLAFNAPYYLDTTEISKLSLYLAAYSKVEPFVNATIRVLFREIVPRGSSPVDVEAINYALQRVLEPDPEQSIPVTLLDTVAGNRLEAPASVRLQAGPIVDSNGHNVRDGRRVDFYAEYAGGVYVPPTSGTTLDGLAEVAFRAESSEARLSQFVWVDIEPQPTAIPTASPRPVPTATTPPPDTPTPSLEPSPSPSPSLPAAMTATDDARPVDGLDLALALVATFLLCAAGSWTLGQRRKQRAYAMRWILLAVCGGMAAYLLYALKLLRPDAWGLLPAGILGSRVAMLLVVAAGALLPWVLRPLISRADQS
jgi:beta-N-acetylhexosaminidase